MSNFTEEQEFLKITSANLLLFAHQREQSNSLRNISMQIGVSQPNAEAVKRLCAYWESPISKCACFASKNS